METLLVIAVVIIRVIQANNIYSALRGDLSYLQLLPRAESKLVSCSQLSEVSTDRNRKYMYDWTGNLETSVRKFS